MRLIDSAMISRRQNHSPTAEAQRRREHKGAFSSCSAYSALWLFWDFSAPRRLRGENLLTGEPYSPTPPSGRTTPRRGLRFPAVSRTLRRAPCPRTPPPAIPVAGQLTPVRLPEFWPPCRPIRVA